MYGLLMYSVCIDTKKSNPFKTGPDKELLGIHGNIFFTNHFISFLIEILLWCFERAICYNNVQYLVAHVVLNSTIIMDYNYISIKNML